MAEQKRLARLPKVDQLLEHPSLQQLRPEVARPLILSAARQTLDGLRARLLDGQEVTDEELGGEAVALAAASWPGAWPRPASSGWSTPPGWWCTPTWGVPCWPGGPWSA